VPRKLWSLISVLLFLLGIGSLALTLYLWFGDWPQTVKPMVDHYRSVGENLENPGDPLIVGALGRSGRDLGGTWQAVIDLYERGELGGIAPLAVEPGTPSDLAEFSFENGLTLEVPRDWNTQDPRLAFYQGVVWYKRTFDHAPMPGKRAFLYFGAVNYTAQVYLNGRLLGRHEGGFTPFNYEVTDALHSGENLLVVRVDNRMRVDDLPTPLTDWLNHGGITREVLLLDLPETFIREYEVRLGASGRDGIQGYVELEGGGAGQTVELEISELGIEESLTTNGEGRAEFAIDAAPQLWSPESPKLYRVRIESGADAVEEEIGFRHVEAKGSQVLLNGEPIFLRGISIHEEALHGQGRTRTREQAEELLRLALELGCNFVRLAHYPHNEHMARVADELGLLVWAEIPVYWAVDFGNEIALARARRQMGELITRDRNRASVIFWSVGNETPISPERQHFLGELAAHVRSLDASRLTTAAMHTPQSDLANFFVRSYIPAMFGLDWGDWTYRVTDPLAEIVDVPSLNEYFGWYYSGALGSAGPWSSHYARRVMIDNIPRITIERQTTKPFVLSELGAGALAGMHAPEEDLAVYTEEYQALVYRQQIEMFRGQEGLVGISPWILKDFRSPMRLYQGVQDYWNRKGLVSDEGQKKAAFGVLRDYYRELAAEG
jgi:beta-glucuronidase